MPRVSYHQGPLLAHIDVVSIYVNVSFANGSSPIHLADWATDPALQQIVSQLNVFLGTTTNSAFMDALGEYSTDQYTIGRGRLTGSYFLAIATPLPLTDESSAQGNAPVLVLPDAVIQQMLSQTIPGLPPPTANRCYFVFVPPGAWLSNDPQEWDPGIGGYHNSFSFQAPSGDSSTVYYAVVKHPNTDAGILGTPFRSNQSCSTYGQHHLSAI